MIFGSRTIKTRFSIPLNMKPRLYGIIFWRKNYFFKFIIIKNAVFNNIKYGEFGPYFTK